MTDKRTVIEHFSPVAFPSVLLISSNGIINPNSAIAYEFYNLSNVPVTINGMFLDRYIAGAEGGAGDAPIDPTSITYLNSFNTWIPQLKAGEIDTTIYTVEFLDNYYSNVLPFHALYVARKGIAIVQGNREEE